MRQMKRGAKRRDASARPTARDRRIVLIDSAPLRQHAASECSSTLAKLDRARAELRRFEEEDRPAYAAWVAATFGPLLTELRENARLIGEQEDLIADVESEMIWSGHSNPRRAYAAVMRKRESPGNEEDHGEEENPSEREGPDITAEERREMFEDFVESIFGINAKDLHPEVYAAKFADFQANVLGENPQSAASETEQTPGSRIKEIYRILVRRLHPDLRAGEDAPVSSVWHEVQEAYEARNLDRLETLLALTEMRDDPAGGNAPLSQLRNALEELARALRTIQRSITQAKLDPAWDFRLPKRHRAPLEKRLRREMERSLADQRWALADLKRILSDWSRPWHPPSKKARQPTPERKRSKPAQAEFDIFG